jgi:hypothetical protein
MGFFWELFNAPFPMGIPDDECEDGEVTAE